MTMQGGFWVEQPDLVEGGTEATRLPTPGLDVHRTPAATRPTIQQEVGDPAGWPFRPELCPADDDFIAYLQARLPEGPRSVFHMGTGLHHRVGFVGAGEIGHYVMGATISSEEASEYLRRKRDGEVPEGYHLLYGDAYAFRPDRWHQATGRRFDIVHLPHLGEMIAEHTDPRIEETILRFGRHLQPAEMEANYSPGGVLVFYNRSAAWTRVRDALERLCGGEQERFLLDDGANGYMQRIGSFRTCEIWERRI